MTVFLLDLNVLQEMGTRGNANVRTWLASVNDDSLRISAITFLEKREGLERERKRRQARGKPTKDIEDALDALDAFGEEFGDREVPIDRKVADEWARMLGAKGKNSRDTALAATARVHDLVVVTRNIKDFEGRDVQVLNPFEPRLC